MISQIFMIAFALFMFSCWTFVVRSVVFPLFWLSQEHWTCCFCLSLYWVVCHIWNGDDLVLYVMFTIYAQCGRTKWWAVKLRWKTHIYELYVEKNRQQHRNTKKTHSNKRKESTRTFACEQVTADLFGTFYHNLVWVCVRECMLSSIGKRRQAEDRKEKKLTNPKIQSINDDCKNTTENKCRQKTIIIDD